MSDPNETAAGTLPFSAGLPPEAPQLGDFRILREVGRGGMGVVYEAEQISLKRRVALKVLRLGIAADAEAMERFRREAETVAGLHHTNIVPLFAAGAEDGAHFYAMQFIDGKSLAAVMDESTPSDPKQVARWGLQAAEALAHAHRRGVIHRDVKPSNLMLDAEGVVWLTDFGLARRADEVKLTMTGAILGTPRYMSPEQAGAAGVALDHRTDVYSLGATLYELAMGRPVFHGATPQAVIAEILNTEPAAPRSLRPDLPRDLETIIVKCLAKDPARRYASAQDLADDLRAFLEGRAIKARRISVAEKLARWAGRQRRTAVVAGVAAGVALLLTLGGIWAWLEHRESNLGRLTLTSQGDLALTVEPLAEDRDDPIAASFTAPTREAVALPGGPCRLRVSRVGQPSETYHAFIEKGREISLHVTFEGRSPWPPIPLPESRDRVELVRLGDHTDVVMLDEWRYLRRIDGATGKVVWEVVLSRDNKDPKKGPVGDALEERHNAISPNQHGPILVDPAPDLDGDGVGDLVWLGSSLGGVRWGPNPVSAWAISGKNGEELWTVAAKQALALGQPAVTDVNGDGRPDLVVAFASQHDSGVSLTAISGKTGERLWESPGEPPRGPRQAVLRLLDLEGKRAVTGVVGRNLVAVDPENGKPLRPARDIGFDPVGRVYFLDTASGPAVLLGRREPTDRVTLVAVSLARGDELWSHSCTLSVTVIAPPRDSSRLVEPRDWLTVADLDGDGKPEVVVPDVVGPPRKAEHRVVALDGSTGQERWRRDLGLLFVNVEPGVLRNRMFDSPKEEGDRAPARTIADRHGNLFIAWVVRHVETRNSERLLLLVEGVDGRTGATRWRWLRTDPRNDTAAVGPLSWWQPGSDGRDDLVVPFVRYPGQDRSPASLHVLASGTGKLVTSVPGFGVPRTADLDGDGIRDLVATADVLGEPGKGMKGLALQALRGTPPIAWRRLNVCRPVGDLDGDGWEDVSHLGGRGKVATASGKSGRLLWRKSNVSASSEDDVGGLPEEGNARCDLLLTRPVIDDRQQAMSLLDGRTGEVRWTATGLAPSDSPLSLGSFFLARHFDLGGDHPRQLVSVHIHERHPDEKTEPAYQLRLAAQSPTNGEILWQRDFGEPVQGKASRSPGSDWVSWAPPERETWRPVTADLDGDGTRDLVFWGSNLSLLGEHSPTYSLHAVSGKDGTSLWSRPVRFNPMQPRTVRPHGYNNGPYPLPAIADLDGDGLPEVVSQADHAPLLVVGDPFRSLVVVVNGRDGKEKWSWKGPGVSAWWMANDPPAQSTTVARLEHRASAPRIVRLAEGPFVCAAVVEGEEVKVPRFNKPFLRPRLSLILLDGKGMVRQRRVPARLAEGNFLFWVEDLTGDGRDEVIFFAEDRLTATEGGIEGVLWERPSAGITSEVLAILPAREGRSGTVILQTGTTVTGLDGATGRERWRCDGPANASNVILTSEDRPLPWLLFHQPGNSGHPEATDCRVAVAVDGRPTPVDSVEASECEDGKYARVLPWVGEWGRYRARGHWTVMLEPGGLPWTVAIIAGLAVVLGLVIASVRRRSWKLGVMTGLLLAGVITAGIWRFGSIDWEGFVTVPVFVFAVGVIVLIRRGHWLRLGVVVLATAILSAVLAWLWLRHDAATLHPWERHDWGGWYLAGLLGVYIVGVAWALWLAVSLPLRWMRPLHGRRNGSEAS